MANAYLDESRIQMLKKRSNRCVCRFCGEPLEIRKIIFCDYEEARLEIFCSHCDRIEFGVEPEIYISAKYFVDTMEFNYFNQLEENEQTRKMTIAKVCDIMAWENKTLGFLNNDGFIVPLSIDLETVGEVLTFTDKDLLEF